MIKKSKITALALSVAMSLTFMVGCSSDKKDSASGSDTEKVFNYGTTAYGASEPGIDPHKGYSGWPAVRYGVGETLFKFNEKMELEPWLATKYDLVDDYTVKIYLRDDVNFQNGKKMTAEAVKACIENLVKVHDRAPDDLAIKSIIVDGQTVTITSNNKVPTLLNYLSDPYGAIIDMEVGADESDNVVGTGPYMATAVTPEEINLVRNENYWGGKSKVDKINLKSFTDGDTMTMALQNGELDATQGLPYGSLDLFKDNKDFKISSADTSRVYQVAFNFKTENLQDLNVRKAISMAIDKEGFTKTLLNGNGSPAAAAFPSNFSFGNDAVKAPKYDIAGAKALLEEAGWKDTDGDGYVDKDGQRLRIRWLTYPSRMELPLLAESAQATLKEIGIEVKVNSTQNHKDFLEKGEYDVYASAFVAAPTGDPQYYITTHLLDNSAYNKGFYHSDEVEKLTEELRNEFDTNKREELAIKIQQLVLDDCAYVYASHLKMSFVMKEGVTGFNAHPSDYYEVTSELDIK
jgi:peptide/nickel transport system substrate-binding protein